MRTSRSNGTKTYNYVYNGSQLTQMTVGSDTLYFTYGLLGPTTVTWNGVTYYYALNGQGDVAGIFDPNGILVVTYNWDNAWGCNPEPEGTMASTLGTLNPLRYRSYVYDEETELYYLQSRYYNPEIGRFINADGYVSTGQGVLGSNMFAYCGNNPGNCTDPAGTFWVELKEAIGQTTAQFAGYFGVAAGISQLDSILLGPADVASGVLLLGGLLVCTGIAVHTTITAPSLSISQPKIQEEKEEKVIAEAIPPKTNDPVVFPVNPYKFTPANLIMIPRAGTKNGRIINWIDPFTYTEVFRWDENANGTNGAHYHIYGEGHYYPGDAVPEPFATLYFPK